MPDDRDKASDESATSPFPSPESPSERIARQRARKRRSFARAGKYLLVGGLLAVLMMTALSFLPAEFRKAVGSLLAVLSALTTFLGVADGIKNVARGGPF